MVNPKLKNESIQIKEFRKRMLISYRKVAEKEGRKYIDSSCLGTISGLVYNPDFSDEMVRKMIRIALEAHESIYDDKSLSWEVD